jgi:hydrogenase-4 component B
MVVPMAVLALSCVAVGIFPGPVLGAISGVADELLRSPGALSAAHVPLRTLAGFNAAVWALVVLGGCAAALAIRRGKVARDSTWGCGYAQPTARMQYTAAAFSELLSQVLVPSRLRPRLSFSRPVSLFPGPSAFSADCSDPMTRGFYEPFLGRWADRFARLRWMQQGLLHVYLVYILVALLIGLAWSSLSSWSWG